MGEAAIKPSNQIYYDQRVAAKLKADSTSILHDDIEVKSAFSETHGNRFRIILEACKIYFSENSSADVKRNSIATAISDVAAHDPTAIDLSGMRYSITTEVAVADKIRAWADTPAEWDRCGIQLVLRQTRIV